MVMNRLYFATIVVLALNCLALDAARIPDREEVAIRNTELEVLRTENFMLTNDIELVYGKGYVTGEICGNILYKTDEGVVTRVGECK
jgi:hypothetical protein